VDAAHYHRLYCVSGGALNICHLTRWVATGILLVGCNRPRIEATLDARPGPALIGLVGRSLGRTPRVVRLNSLKDTLKLSASMGEVRPVETRFRILSLDSVEVTFYFGEGSSVMAKALGLPRVLVFDYGNVPTFEVDKWDLSPEFVSMLDHQADLLRQHFPGIPVFICGHTDPTGSIDHNAMLSLRRAEEVAGRLRTCGLNDGRIKVQGFGSAYPVASNYTAIGRALNRRTEIILPQ
jgi:outer membrane protein OmpA-like peptidoglycan-associated protein